MVDLGIYPLRTLRCIATQAHPVEYPAQATPALVSNYLALIREIAMLVVVTTELRGVIGDSMSIVSVIIHCGIELLHL
jgi:hypothetical protein